MPRCLKSCRSCGGPNLEQVLDLGRTPLANSLPTEATPATPEPTYPLELAYCPSCTLMQLTESVPPEQIFAEYPYFSSFSDTMLLHASQLVERLRRLRTGRQGGGQVGSDGGAALRLVGGVPPAVGLGGIDLGQAGRSHPPGRDQLHPR